MSLAVSICTTSGFLATLVRKSLSRVRHVHMAADHRDHGAALSAIREDAGLVIVDAELLGQTAPGAALRKAINGRRAPTIVLDARATGVGAEIAVSALVCVLRGARAGELDADLLEAPLQAAIASARRARIALDDGGPAAISDAEGREGALGPVAPYDGALELVVVAASTGGPTLLMELVSSLTAPTVPFLIVQHMPASETGGFAGRLAEVSGLAIVEIERGPLPPVGTIGVLRGGRDYRLERRREGVLALRETEVPGNPFHPSVDEVLRSAVAANVKVGAVVLTGMGQDGAAGALAMARVGLPVVAQRPDTCTVAGMPRAVIENGAARSIEAPPAIAKTLNRWSDRAARAEGPSP